MILEACWRNRSRVLIVVLIALVVLQYLFSAPIDRVNIKVLWLGSFNVGETKIDENQIDVQPAAPQNNVLTKQTTLPSSSFALTTIVKTDVPFEQEIDNATLVIGSEAPSLAPSQVSVFRPQPDVLEECPALPPVLVGPIKVWFDYPSLDELQAIYPFVQLGGHSVPADCKSRNRVAVIIPYRNRGEQLRAFLHNLHSLLTKQQLDYAIFIVNQATTDKFNRAKLMNIGFVEARNLYDWQCYIFHDVDLFPEDDRNLYTCPDSPRHMSVAVDKFQYKLPYNAIFGGITAFKKEHFELVNGYPNDYWGWGGEDDDMSTRVSINGFKIARYESKIARYKMIKHQHEKENKANDCRYKIMQRTKRRWKTDGLSNLQYKLLSVEFEQLYTNITVDLEYDKSMIEFNKLGINCSANKGSTSG